MNSEIRIGLLYLTGNVGYFEVNDIVHNCEIGIKQLKMERP